jgi:pimeloyl-ACP methyl ester carboxylesterase
MLHGGAGSAIEPPSNPICCQPTVHHLNKTLGLRLREGNMRQKLTRTIAIAALLGALAGCAAPVGSPTPAASTATFFPREQRESMGNWITSAALANNLIGSPAARTYDVYLPPSYPAGDRRYPVVYILQGFGGGVNFARVTQQVDELVARGEAQEMILVFFDGVNRFGGSFYLSSPTIGDYETFIAEELVSLVDSTFRTLPTRDSRGITGCSMGGYGSLHLALKRPDVFGVTVPMSGPYDWEHLDLWEAAQAGFTHELRDFNDYYVLGGETKVAIALAAAAAPNPDNPPFYLDMPFELADGQPQIVPEVFQRIIALDPVNDLRRYLDQPVRLRGLMIFQDTDLGEPDVEGAERFTEAARIFDRVLTEEGVDHEYLEVEACHCCADWGPILGFLSDHLAH